MTIRSFVCDHPGCTSPDGEYESQPGTGLREVVKDLRRLGWTLRDGEHYCPEHKPSGDSR